jgi:hypothetical protein
MLPRMADRSPIFSAELRRLLRTTFPTNIDLEAFLVDHFPEVFRRFPSEMGRIERENLLLMLVEPEEILLAMSRAVPASGAGQWLSRSQSAAPFPGGGQRRQSMTCSR